MLPGKSHNLLPRHFQQRAEQGNVPEVRVRDIACRLHARDALQPGSAQQIQYQCFCIVIGIVRHRNGRVAMLPA